MTRKTAIAYADIARAVKIADKHYPNYSVEMTPEGKVLIVPVAHAQAKKKRGVPEPVSHG